MRGMDACSLRTSPARERSQAICAATEAGPVPPAKPLSGELVSIRKAAQILGMNTSSIHRWLADGFIAGEQVTPGAPWQIRINEELRSRIVQQAPPEYVPMIVATAKLGVSRQTVLQRVKRGELKAVLVRQGRHKGLRIKVVDEQPQLFQ